MKAAIGDVLRFLIRVASDPASSARIFGTDSSSR